MRGGQEATEVCSGGTEVPGRLPRKRYQLGLSDGDAVDGNCKVVELGFIASGEPQYATGMTYTKSRSRLGPLGRVERLQADGKKIELGIETPRVMTLMVMVTYIRPGSFFFFFN